MSPGIRVASYNVHGCRGRGGRRDVVRIARVLGEIHADVVGLQEVESRHGRSDVDQAERLAEALGMACVEGPLLLARRGWYGNALLTRLTVQSARRVLFDRHGREARGALVCDLLGRDGTSWRVMTTHLDLRSGHRRCQFEMLLDELVPVRPRPTVLMGDFNEWWPFSRALRAVRRHAALPPAPPTFPSWLPFMRLDRIAHSGCRLQGEVRCHVTPLSRLASDHLPVFADLIAEPGGTPAAAITARADAAPVEQCR